MPVANSIPLNVTILGDSRVFDTYYTNSRYSHRYGYDRTFPHVWRKSVLADPMAGYDVVHIPDHFRSGTIQNNIVRLALTDPAAVVILDGIWDTLLNKGHFLAYAERENIASPETAYSRGGLAKLFRAGRLPVSPAGYAARQQPLISYFRRRRRQVIWMTLPVPPNDYVGSTYHAGDYVPNPDWDDCLAAVNEAMIPLVNAYGGAVLDTTVLMNEVGGAKSAFIDQWHFSEAFHARIAEVLEERTRALLAEAPGPGHVSHDYMLGAPISSNPPPETVVVYEGDPANEIPLLRLLKSEQILVYPSELGEIDNPLGDDRAEFEKQAAR